MRNFFFIILFSSIFSRPSFATNFVSVRSRNMPTHCEFVYQVHSEVEVRWSPGINGTNLAFELYEEYSGTWQPAVFQEAKCTNATLISCRVLLAFESMSTSSKYLFRKMKFRMFNENNEELTGTYLTTFGREFGEKCHDIPDQTPFRPRVVTQL